MKAPRLMYGFLVLAAAFAPAARADVLVWVGSVTLDLRYLGPTAVQLPVRIDTSVGPAELGAFNLALNAVSSNGAFNTITLDGATAGDVFDPSNFFASSATGLADLVIANDVLTDVTLNPGSSFLLATLDLTVDVTKPGIFTLDFDPAFTQFANGGGLLPAVTLAPGSVLQNIVVIPEPATAWLGLMGLSILAGLRVRRMRRFR